MFHRTLQILYNHSVGEGYHSIGFQCSEMAKASKPGQFLMLRMLDQTWEGRLSRPFSISNVKDDIIEIVFETVGRSTKNLAGADKGKTMQVIGPLGNGFSIIKDAVLHILAAGGIGIAPFPFLGLRIMQECLDSKVMLLFGVRSVSKLLLTKFFESYKIDMKLSSNDGSVGIKGFVSNLLEKELESIAEKKFAVYACGPNPMLKTVSQISIAKGIECQISMEEIMACGVGACLGCACKVRKNDDWGYEMVCKDGPVFPAERVIFNEY